jgi:hypothetical protein
MARQPPWKQQQKAVLADLAPSPAAATPPAGPEPGVQHAAAIGAAGLRVPLADIPRQGGAAGPAARHGQPRQAHAAVQGGRRRVMFHSCADLADLAPVLPDAVAAAWTPLPPPLPPMWPSSPTHPHCLPPPAPRPAVRRRVEPRRGAAAAVAVLHVARRLGGPPRLARDEPAAAAPQDPARALQGANTHAASFHMRLAAVASSAPAPRHPPTLSSPTPPSHQPLKPCPARPTTRPARSSTPPRCRTTSTSIWWTGLRRTCWRWGWARASTCGAQRRARWAPPVDQPRSGARGLLLRARQQRACGPGPRAAACRPANAPGSSR